MRFAAIAARTREDDALYCFKVRGRRQDLIEASHSKSQAPLTGSKYKCIGFAAGDTESWWWPDQAGEDIWPVRVPRAETLKAFRELLVALGYAWCNREVCRFSFLKDAMNEIRIPPLRNGK